MLFPDEIEDGRDRVGIGAYPAQLRDGTLRPLLGKVLDRRDDQIFFGPEMMHLGAPGDSGKLSHPRRGGAGITVCDQTLHSGIQQPCAHRGGALGLSPPGLSPRRHSRLPHPVVLRR